MFGDNPAQRHSPAKRQAQWLRRFSFLGPSHPGRADTLPEQLRLKPNESRQGKSFIAPTNLRRIDRGRDRREPGGAIISSTNLPSSLLVLFSTLQAQADVPVHAQSSRLHG